MLRAADDREGNCKKESGIKVILRGERVRISESPGGGDDTVIRL